MFIRKKVMIQTVLHKAATRGDANHGTLRVLNMEVPMILPL